MTENGETDFLREKPNNITNLQTQLQKARWTCLLTITGIATTLGTAVPVGYNIGVINSPAAYMTSWCNETLILRYGIHLNSSELNTFWSVVVSIFLIGGCIGSLLGATFSDKFGRKGTLSLCGGLFLIASFFFYAARAYGTIEVLLLARLVVGLASGLTTSVLPMYLAEIAPLELCGTLAVFSSMGVTSGVVVGQVASLQELLGSEERWHFALSAYGVLVFVCFLPYLWFPESPKYLFIICGKREQARKALLQLRGGNEIDRVNVELEAMHNETTNQYERRSLWSVLSDKTLLLPLVLVSALQGGQQLSGVNAVFYYSVTIFQNAGLDAAYAKWANLGTGCVNMITACFSPLIMKHLNRRPVIMGSCFFSGIFLVTLTLVMGFVKQASVLPVLCVFGYILSYQIGLGPIPYFIGSELFEVSPRPAAMSIGSLASWACNFYVGMTFLSFSNLLGVYVFLPFAVVCFGLVALMYRYLPESRGRPTAEIVPQVSHGFNSKPFIE